MSEIAKPLVSVIIPTKDRLELLKRAVRSVDQQTYDNIEIVIVDDASAFPVVLDEFARTLVNASIKIVRNDKSIGGAAARNKGVSASSGDFIAFLDDDDIYYHDKISVLLQYLNDNTKVDLVFGRVMLNDGLVRKEHLKYPEKFSADLNILVRNYIHTASSLIRRSALEHIKFNEELPRYQDSQFYIELTLKKNIAFVDHLVAEWFIDGRHDQITSINSPDKLKKAYLAFKSLNQYLKDGCNIQGKYQIIYDACEIRLGISAGELKRGALWKLIYRSRKNFFTLIRAIFINKWLYH